jgi:hypothetical protein
MKYLFDEADSGGLQITLDDEIRDFIDENFNYKVFFNGRSDGYLVICNKDGSSVLPDCVYDYDSYADFKADIKEQGYNISDFKRELREAVEIIREFDKLCDRLRDLVNEYSKKSFDSDKLGAAIEWFNNEYGDDLVMLDLTGPVLEGDRVRLNDIVDYHAFMQCFLKCLGEDRRRIATDSADEYLWLKEN